ncbi:unnamed protein product [Owenia fusiformis]|uniref:Mitochondrial nucleoid factor 1 n=1 Tax=Owenia fusiformis TaxID=6347 RepID=A0A8S4PX11_OWEFU|nr:unnamed protein product [Owenia fusiformis]
MSAARYKNFLRLCKNWPLDKSKTGRDIGERIRAKIGEAFRQGETTTLNEAECDRLYASLSRLNTNYYKNLYKRNGDSTAMGATQEECNLVISNEGQEALRAHADRSKWDTMKGYMGMAPMK